jgi:regulator of nucleoside diphosphate kinase
MTTIDATATQSCRLTERDFSVLEAILRRRQALGDPVAPLIDRKLATAHVVPANMIEAGVATLNSRVVFRVDAGAAETRLLVEREAQGAIGLGLLITTRRGLALLGMAEGQTAVIERRAGDSETVRLEQVLYQPEAARKRLAAAPTPPSRGGPRLTLVHSAPTHRHPLGEFGKIRQRWDDNGDDPGPSAA